MNWFRYAARYRIPLQEVVNKRHPIKYKDEWSNPIPEGYELIQYDDGAWAVLRPVQGTVYYDSDTNKLLFYNGTGWESIDSTAL